MKKIQAYFWIAAVVLCLLVALNTETKPKKVNLPTETTSVTESNDETKTAQTFEQKVGRSVNRVLEEKFYPGVVRARSLWIENKRYLHDYIDGFKSGDKEFLLQMVREGRAKFVENPAGVACEGTYKDGEVIKIRFFEGRYRGKSGYIFADFVHKVKEK